MWTTETKPFSQDLEADSVQALEELEQDPVLRFISFGSISWPVEWLERIWHYVGRKVIGRSVSGINQNAGVVAFAGVIVGAIGIAVALLR
ncbi:MAG: hypothetical protein F4X54_10700 [Chloroflexi bacterium]|nr:hypothetical protein [Chloroflexota bacterium]